MSFWLWLLIIVAVAVLVIVSQVGTARAWAGRVFGRVLPALPSSAAVGAFFGSFKLKAAVLALLIAPVAVFGVVKYIEGRGADRAKLAHERALNDASTRARRAENGLAWDNTRRRDASDTERSQRNADVAAAQQEIANAQDLETRLAAYRAARDGLRRAATEHLSRADADYVSSIPEG